MSAVIPGKPVRHEEPDGGRVVLPLWLHAQLSRAPHREPHPAPASADTAATSRRIEL